MEIMTVSRRLFCLTLVFALAAVWPAPAHPIPSLSYDRTLRVRLTSSGVEVKYSLQVSGRTLLTDIDKLPNLNNEKLATAGPGNPNPLYEAFYDGIAPLLADRLEAWH